METTPRRARSAEEKEERRTHLLRTARAALEPGQDGTIDLRALSLNELARRAGMAKANVYRYFESREAILLALLWAEWAVVETSLRSRLDHLGPDHHLGPEALADLLTAELLASPLLCALIAALPSTLEQNLSEAAIVAFKQATLDSFRNLAEDLATRCPALGPARHLLLLNDTCAAIAGLYPFCHPAAPAAHVMNRPEFSPLVRNFAVDLPRFVRALAIEAAASGG